MKYEDLPEDIKPLCWDGKEPITRLSDIKELHIDPTPARLALIKISEQVVANDLKGWGFNENGKPVMLNQQ